MRICGMEKMSLVDYDGLVCATIFTGGCNFKCGFCHNSALVLSYAQIPTIPEEEVLSYLKKRFGILDGVCVSGGEPTLQKDLPDFLKKVKDIGYKIKLDTNGTNPELIKTLYRDGLIDYFAMDIKNDRDNYAKIIGFDSFDVKNVEKSVDFLTSISGAYEFRTTIIKEFHSADNMLNIGKWLNSAEKYFLQKFKNGENCIQTDLSEIDDQTAVSFINVLKPFIPNAKLRGYDIK